MVDGLLVGAYERDNFGDLLFLDHTRHFLQGIETKACGLIDADMTGVGGAQVAAYQPHLAGERVPFLWVVGGETGGTTMRNAASMLGLSNSIRPDEIENQLNLPDFVSPYLPRPSRYPATTTSISIINSVGVSGIWSLSGRHRIETIAALQEASFLSVRDLPSSAELRRLKIPHRLAPDLVHTIVNVIPDDVTTAQREIALVQAKSKYIDQIGVREFARILLNSSALRRFQIRLFSAGEAVGHDSRDQLVRVAGEFRGLGGGDRIDVSQAFTPEEKAKEIATAGLWIGTSLHGYIISTSFNVPRVGLMLRKVRQYATSWEIPYPSAVPLRSLDDSVDAALQAAKVSDGARLAANLSELAEQNVLTARRLVEDAGEYDRGGFNAEIEKKLQRVSRTTETIERQYRRARRSRMRAAEVVRGFARARDKR